MKVLIVSASDINGGAARAAYRLHKALASNSITSKMVVRSKLSDDYSVIRNEGRTARILDRVRPGIGGLVMRLQKPSDSNLRSGNWLPSNLSERINRCDCDVVNLHWLGSETMSIEDIGRISKPIVWTLHDMWPFCGAEHYSDDNKDSRWRVGYSSVNRNKCSKGIDLDRLVWLRKRRSWKQAMHIVSPSNWLADCARGSALFSQSKISVIPNALDTDIYKPSDKGFCRDMLGLPQDKKILLFGAIGGSQDPRKGYDLLSDALQYLNGRRLKENLLCVFFGQSEPQDSPVLPCQIRWFGHVHDDSTLALLYNSADIIVVPSRQENLPQIATEAQACGCPVVAFKCTGFSDAVSHNESGYLAKPYDAEDMAEGIMKILGNETLQKKMGENARARAISLWSNDIVVKKYMHVYRKAINSLG